MRLVLRQPAASQRCPWLLSLTPRTPHHCPSPVLPPQVDKIIIHHPTSVAPDDIMDSLQGMTKGYGLAAAGTATVAGLMLPIAMGVDLIILPGPQVRSVGAAGGVGQGVEWSGAARQ